ncbi:MBOAT family O-acyltransferase [Nanoarchaeota archaeon]
MIKDKKYQYLLLLIGSYFFYYYSSGFLVVLLLFSTFLDFYCGKAIYSTINKSKRKLYLSFSLIGNLGLLAFFKYTNFSIETINYLSTLFGSPTDIQLLNIILPIGISFYTFQTMSYTLDIYWKKMRPTDSILKFGLYVAFFPQLVAGPIVRAADFIPQLTTKVKIHAENFKAGLTLIGWGLVKKVVFADNIAVFVDSFFSDPTKYSGSLPVFIAALAFGIQIYCDFSGYSDIAIGIARVLGYKLKLNFDKPYFTTNFTQFWRRWHMSLSSWLKDYLYIPLGGNRKGKTRTYINLMATMVLGGLWHGAAWNFLFWGFYQGVLLCIHKISSSLGITKIFEFFGKYKKYVLLILTQYFVFMGWLMFRVSNVRDLTYLVYEYLTFDFSNFFFTFKELINNFHIPLFFLLVFVIIHIYTFFNRNFVENMAKKDLFYWGLYLFVVMMSLYFLRPATSIQFIYFQF